MSREPAEEAGGAPTETPPTQGTMAVLAQLGVPRWLIGAYAIAAVLGPVGLGIASALVTAQSQQAVFERRLNELEADNEELTKRVRAMELTDQRLSVIIQERIPEPRPR